MSTIRLWERLILPDYTNVKQICWGTVNIDGEKCNGCGFCVRACPSDSLYLENRKAVLKPVKGYPAGDPGLNQCICCGDCVAICPNGAIATGSTYTWTRYFKTLGRGRLSGPRLKKSEY